MKDFNIGVWLSKVTIVVGAFCGLAEALMVVGYSLGWFDAEQTQALQELVIAASIAIAAFVSKKDLDGVKNADGEKK